MGGENMKCPVCRSPYNTVYDTRDLDDARKLRRRKCLDCGHRFRTVELLAGTIQKKGRRGRQEGDAKE